jgi:hypothetical protein
MLRKTAYLLLGIFWLASAPAISAQDAATDVHVKLSLADNKTIYRIGDPIRLILEFTADRDGYQADTIPDRTELTSDAIFVSPDSGVRHWLDEYLHGRRYVRDVISLARLSNAPTRVALLLNDSIRFGSAGKYSLKVTTRRVTPISTSREYHPPPALTTNEISFEVQPMSEADEEKEVKRLSDLLDAAHGWQAEEKLTEEMSFLTGDPSSREKVRRFLNSKGRSGNYLAHITYGLYIARNRALVFQLLETAMRDANTPVTYGLLMAVTNLRLLRENSGLPEKPLASVAAWEPHGDPKLTAIQDDYVAELAAGLTKRAGKSLTTTAMTILMRLPKAPETAVAILRVVRPILLQQFEELNPYDKEYLLSAYWDQLRDPSLLPVLKRMLKSQDMPSRNIHGAALKRLIEMAPDEALPFVVSEILDPASQVNFDILQSLADSSLPEIDAPLLEQIRRLSSSKRNYDVTYLKPKTDLAARYATVAIYSDLMELYQQDGARWPLDAKAGLFAYFARHNENEALPLIEQTLADLEPGQDFNLLPDLTRLYYSDGIDALLRKRLEGDEPRAVSTAAWLISKYGPPADEKIIEARLERWRKEWGNRAAEAQANLQATAERELVTALMRAKSWKATPERVNELRQSCVTDLCRQNFH